ncbi:phBC6A51 family helix-turn-helix protein [Aneurinibacillus sp. UBA3580]|jgi:transcriptional regulator with XRE-family HTH domain|uniref:phBC6A51 family helix-turn-helix protein n=1 Tax=Aneurinibacillus sp. UBA3580 TaxID=1946041 RepID=UPI00257A2CBC|nr:phBC6A51 family helix-turn-helix protein [Aneurinibacillus sp. UBA3580]
MSTRNTKLTPEQQRAADMVVANEYRLLTPDKKKKLTQAELAEMLGISERTLRYWKEDSAFRDYMAQESRGYAYENRAKIFGALIGLASGELTPNGVPSVNAIKTYLQMEGLLSNTVEIKDERKQPEEDVYKSEEEVAAEMAELKAMLGGNDDGDSTKDNE